MENCRDLIQLLHIFMLATDVLRGATRPTICLALLNWAVALYFN